MNPTVAKAISAIGEIFPDGFEGTVAFDIRDAGRVTLDRSGTRAGGDAADITISADADTFAGIISGRMNPMSLYLSGRITVVGNLGLAARLAERLR